MEYPEYFLVSLSTFWYYFTIQLCLTRGRFVDRPLRKISHLPKWPLDQALVNFLDWPRIFQNLSNITNNERPLQSLVLNKLGEITGKPFWLRIDWNLSSCVSDISSSGLSTTIQSTNSSQPGVVRDPWYQKYLSNSMGSKSLNANDSTSVGFPIPVIWLNLATIGFRAEFAKSFRANLKTKIAQINCTLQNHLKK